MELDGRQYTAIEDSGYCLPQDLHQANTSEVGDSPFGDHNHHLLGTRCCELSSPEGNLYYDNNITPVSRVRVFLLCCHAKPHPKVFCPHSGRASGTMYSRTHHHLSNILLPWDILSTGKGSISMGIGHPGSGTWVYISASSTVRFSRDRHAGGGGLLAEYLYHPRIRTHAHLTRGGSDTRRDSIVQSASSTCLFQSVLRPARIRRLSCRTVHCPPSWSVVTLAYMAAHISSEIQSRLTRSCRGGLGI